MSAYFLQSGFKAIFDGGQHCFKLALIMVIKAATECCRSISRLPRFIRVSRPDAIRSARPQFPLRFSKPVYKTQDPLLNTVPRIAGMPTGMFEVERITSMNVSASI